MGTMCFYNTRSQTVLFSTLMWYMNPSYCCRGSAKAFVSPCLQSPSVPETADSRTMGTFQSHTLQPASTTHIEPDTVVSTSLSRKNTLTTPHAKATDRLAGDVWINFMPDNPWIKILSYLSQKDRLAVSRTCRRLHQLCLQEPCLWRSLSITIGADFNKRRRRISRKRKLKLDQMEESALRHCISSRGVRDLEILFKVSEISHASAGCSSYYS